VKNVSLILLGLISEKVRLALCTYLDFRMTKEVNSSVIGVSPNGCGRQVQRIIELEDRVGLLSDTFQIIKCGLLYNASCPCIAGGVRSESDS